MNLISRTATKHVGYAMVLAAVSVLSACQTTQTSGSAAVTAIAAQDSELLYAPIQPDNLKITYRRSETSSATAFRAVGRSDNGLFPHLVFTYRYLAPNWHWNQPIDLKEYVKELKLAENRNVQIGKHRGVRTEVGLISVLRFTVDGVSCSAMELELRGSGSQTHDGGSAQFFGHYCWAPGATVSDEDEATVAKSVAMGNYGGWESAVARIQQSPGQANEKNLALTVAWQNYRDALSGRMVLTSSGAHGRIWFPLPAGGNCSGDWKNVGGKFAGDGPLPSGTWSVLCTNGRSAQGDYAAFSPDSGTGIGKDAEDNTIAFRFGDAGTAISAPDRIDNKMVCRITGAEISAWYEGNLLADIVKAAQNRNLSRQQCSEYLAAT